MCHEQGMKMKKVVVLTYHLSVLHLLVPVAGFGRLPRGGGVVAGRRAGCLVARRRARRQDLPQLAQEGAEEGHHGALGHRQRPAQGTVVLGGQQGRRKEVQHGQRLLLRDGQPEGFEFVRSAAESRFFMCLSGF